MNLRPSIIKMFSFFDIFSRGLTFLELKKWLWTEEKIEGDALWQELKNLPETKEVEGFFFLSKSDAGAAESRMKQEFITKRKMKVAMRAGRILNWVPFIKLVALCNSVSFGTAKEESDIDFFIVARVGRIWVVRFYANLFLRLFGLRTFKNKMANRICLSFFVDENNLNLRPLSLADKSDVYLHYWITTLIPLINREKTLEKFWQSNSWIKKNLANWDGNKEEGTCLVENVIWVGVWQNFWENFLAGKWGEALEKFLRLAQMKKINKTLYWNKQDKNDMVIKDGVLKFHTPDKKERYFNLWQEKIADLTK